MKRRASFIPTILFALYLAGSFESVLAENIGPLLDSVRPTDNALDSKSFLERARRPPAQETWAKLSGEASHRRSGAETVKSPIAFSVRFTPERTVAQVFIDDSEAYNISQIFSAEGGGTTIIPFNKKDKGKSVLENFGLRPEDLAFSFLFWNLDKELAPDTAKGQDCRVFLLVSPGGEVVKVFLSIEHFFPLKAEWFRAKGDAAPYRTVEVTSFSRRDDFWFPDGLSIYGPGFRTKIEFPELSAGKVKDSVPEDLFKKTEHYTGGH